jgi:hypothetical protein
MEGAASARVVPSETGSNKFSPCQRTMGASCPSAGDGEKLEIRNRKRSRAPATARRIRCTSSMPINDRITAQLIHQRRSGRRRVLKPMDHQHRDLVGIVRLQSDQASSLRVFRRADHSNESEPLRPILGRHHGRPDRIVCRQRIAFSANRNFVAVQRILQPEFDPFLPKLDQSGHAVGRNSDQAVSTCTIVQLASRWR